MWVGLRRRGAVCNALGAKGRVHRLVSHVHLRPVGLLTLTSVPHVLLI